MISGINHITLAVRDAGESIVFYAGTLGCKIAARWSGGAYLVAGDVWLCLHQDDSVRRTMLPEYTHIAFTVAQEDFNDMCTRIRSSGARIWQENRSEGASLYFTDPNGHKLEIHTTNLQARLASIRQKPWNGLEVFM
jgi:catechol 2,3-dioxygenase-like lactoylglutathione lyase family enzyme